MKFLFWKGIGYKYSQLFDLLLFLGANFCSIFAIPFEDYGACFGNLWRLNLYWLKNYANLKNTANFKSPYCKLRANDFSVAWLFLQNQLQILIWWLRIFLWSNTNYPVSWMYVLHVIYVSFFHTKVIFNNLKIKGWLKFY